MSPRKMLAEVGIRAVISAIRKTDCEQWVSDSLIPRTHGDPKLQVKPAVAFRYFRCTNDLEKKQRTAPGVLPFEKTSGSLTLSEKRAEANRLAALS